MVKLYYTLTEVAETLNVDPSLLLFWEKEFGSLIKPFKNDKGILFYKNENINVIKQIYSLVETQGLVLNEAKTKTETE